MKLKDFKKAIDKLVKEGHGSDLVIFASDDEGNNYSDVFYGPNPISLKEIFESYRGKGKSKDTAICIN